MMELLRQILSWNEILTVSLLGWFTAQVLKTITNAILMRKFQLERMWGDGGMHPDGVIAIITMHDAMGVRHETGEQAKVLNNMIEMWIEFSEKNAPFLRNMHLKEMVGHTPLQVVAGICVGVVVGFLYPISTTFV